MYATCTLCFYLLGPNKKWLRSTLKASARPTATSPSPTAPPAYPKTSETQRTNPKSSFSESPYPRTSNIDRKTTPTPSCIHLIPKSRSFLDIERADRVLIIGTTLSTFSAFRLLKHALELKKRVLVINVGPTRADGVRGVERMDVASGEIMTDVVRVLL